MSSLGVGGNDKVDGILEREKVIGSAVQLLKSMPNKSSSLGTLSRLELTLPSAATHY